MLGTLLAKLATVDVSFCIQRSWGRPDDHVQYKMSILKEDPYQFEALCTPIVGVWNLHNAFELPRRIKIPTHELHLCRSHACVLKALCNNKQWDSPIAKHAISGLNVAAKTVLCVLLKGTTHDKSCSRDTITFSLYFDGTGFPRASQ